MRRGRSLAVSIFVATVAVVPFTGSASAVESLTIEVSDTGALVAKGLRVTVPVTVTCTPSPEALNTSAGTNVFITQRRGSSIVQGNGIGQDVACDGTAHTYIVTVVASGRPFKAGEAIATATATACDEFGCDFFDIRDTEVIRIRN